MPARNNRPSDFSAATANRVIVIEGGSRMPSVPPAAVMPAANPPKEPRLRLSVTPPEPMAEQVAGNDPAIDANNAQANSLATPSPPGTRCSQACRAEYKSCPARDLPIAAPLRMKSGIERRGIQAISPTHFL